MCQHIRKCYAVDALGQVLAGVWDKADIHVFWCVYGEVWLFTTMLCIM